MCKIRLRFYSILPLKAFTHVCMNFYLLSMSYSFSIKIFKRRSEFHIPYVKVVNESFCVAPEVYCIFKIIANASRYIIIPSYIRYMYACAYNEYVSTTIKELKSTSYTRNIVVKEVVKRRMVCFGFTSYQHIEDYTRRGCYQAY